MRIRTVHSNRSAYSTASACVRIQYHHRSTYSPARSRMRIQYAGCALYPHVVRTWTVCAYSALRTVHHNHTTPQVESGLADVVVFGASIQVLVTDVRRRRTATTHFKVGDEVMFWAGGDPTVRPAFESKVQVALRKMFVAGSVVGHEGHIYTVLPSSEDTTRPGGVQDLCYAHAKDMRAVFTDDPNKHAWVVHDAGADATPTKKRLKGSKRKGGVPAKRPCLPAILTPVGLQWL